MDKSIFVFYFIIWTAVSATTAILLPQFVEPSFNPTLPIELGAISATVGVVVVLIIRVFKK